MLGQVQYLYATTQHSCAVVQEYQNRSRAYSPARKAQHHTLACGFLLAQDNLQLQGSSPSVSLPFLYDRLGLARVTNSSALEGWMPTVASSCVLVMPTYSAAANPCSQPTKLEMWHRLLKHQVEMRAPTRLSLRSWLCHFPDATMPPMLQNCCCLLLVEACACCQ